jgi:hypothetical protein
MTIPGTQDPASSPAGMRFSIDAWDVSYGTALAVAEEELPASVARVDTDVETPADQWAPIPARSDLPHPSAVLFVDGVRRIDARVWIDDSATGTGTATVPLPAGMAATASMAVCASYAAGVVCCCGQPGRRQAHLLAGEVRRGLFTTAAHATDIRTRTGTYRARHTVGSDTVPLTMTLSNALQQALAEIEVITALAARAALPRAAEHAGSPPGGHAEHAGSPPGGHAEHAGSPPGGPGGTDDDLLVIDGPLRNRTHLPRTMGLIKTHRAGYLAPELNQVVATLTAGQRTPVFLMGTTWERHAWYLRLPSSPDVPGAPWAGVVRCEAAADLSRVQLTALADLSQTVLCRYASVAYKDARAPQNLVPIAGLENTLRHRLGDTRILYRALREAAR